MDFGIFVRCSARFVVCITVAQDKSYTGNLLYNLEFNVIFLKICIISTLLYTSIVSFFPLHPPHPISRHQGYLDTESHGEKYTKFKYCWRGVESDSKFDVH